MGKTTWDKVSGADSEIQHSVATLANPTERFVLHRDLSVSLPMARRLAQALTSERRFQEIVPTFLRNWAGDGDNYLLEMIARLIERKKLAGNSAWRFGVTPLPLPKRRPAITYYFEIRFIGQLEAIIPPTKVVSVGDGLRQKEGKLRSSFTRALQSVMKEMKYDSELVKTYPGGAQVLAEVFQVPIPAMLRAKKAKRPAKRKK
jgi:hypothetical protein